MMDYIISQVAIANEKTDPVCPLTEPYLHAYRLYLYAYRALPAYLHSPTHKFTEPYLHAYRALPAH